LLSFVFADVQKMTLLSVLISSAKGFHVPPLPFEVGRTEPARIPPVAAGCWRRKAEFRPTTAYFEANFGMAYSWPETD
jgi:hypothetical protein